jgi:two-component system, cell cycle sensor histidine kinase and response regulator CckA
MQWFPRRVNNGKQELRLRLGQQQALTHLGQLALTEVPAQELLDEACRLLAAELRADLTAVLELVPDRGSFVLRAAVGWPHEQIGVWRVPTGPRSHSGYTLMSSRPVIMYDAARETRFEISPQMASQGVSSGLSTSIGSNGGTFGILCAHTYARRRFSEHDVTFLAGVASVLASALRRRVAEAESEKTHRVLEAVIEGTTDDVFVKDLDGRMVALNASAALTLGLPREEVIGRTLHEVMPRAMADMMAETDRLILERDTVETFEERVPVGDETAVFLATKGPYRARDGTVLGTFGIAHDITLRTKQEQELARSEERFRLAQEGARMGTWDVDLVTGITTWSDGLRTLYGVDADYPAGFEHLLPLVHPEDRERVTAEVTEADAHGVDFEFEFRIVRPSGEPCWLLARTSSFRGDDGELVRVLGVAVDITALKQGEQELRAAKEYADRLIETSNALVLVLDRDANIVTFNAAAEEITGYSREEVLGRSWDLLLPRDLYPEAWAELARLSEGGLPERYESPILTKSGHERLIFWQNSELRDLSDAVVGTVSFGIDMTEAALAKEQSEQAAQSLQLLETRLRQAEKLEAIGQLAGGVAHDFNNLLVAVRGSGELALERLARGEEGVADDLEEVLRSTDRGAALTRQLLAFGRRQVLNPEVLDLNDVVLQTSGLLERIIGENVELRTVVTESPVVVKADRGQLEQVITNLAINARDSMPDGGRVTIRVNTSDLDTDAAQLQALLSVSDGGSGIDAATAAHIFEPFFTTKGEKGTGLGLATVHGIVAQSGGQVELDTELGRGSTFTVSLPLLIGGLPAVPAVPKAVSRNGGSETVLLVEDDPTVRSIVSRMLGVRGYDIVEAASGEDAIRFFESGEHSIDLILSDLMMSGIDGRKTLECIREIDPETKVLYMSGYSEDLTIHSNGLESAAGFIQKPFTGDELATRVRELLDEASGLSRDPVHVSLVQA